MCTAGTVQSSVQQVQYKVVYSRYSTLFNKIIVQRIEKGRMYAHCTVKYLCTEGRESEDVCTLYMVQCKLHYLCTEGREREDVCTLYIVQCKLHYLCTEGREREDVEENWRQHVQCLMTTSSQENLLHTFTLFSR